MWYRLWINEWSWFWFSVSAHLKSIQLFDSSNLICVSAYMSSTASLKRDVHLKCAHFVLGAWMHTSRCDYFCSSQYGEVCLLLCSLWSLTSSCSTHPYLRPAPPLRDLCYPQTWTGNTCFNPFPPFVLGINTNYRIIIFNVVDVALTMLRLKRCDDSYRTSVESVSNSLWRFITVKKKKKYAEK